MGRLGGKLFFVVVLELCVFLGLPGKGRFLVGELPVPRLVSRAEECSQGTLSSKIKITLIQEIPLSTFELIYLELVRHQIN